MKIPDNKEREVGLFECIVSPEFKKLLYEYVVHERDMYHQWSAKNMLCDPHFAYEHFVRMNMLLELLEELELDYYQDAPYAQRIAHFIYLNNIKINSAAFDLTKE